MEHRAHASLLAGVIASILVATAQAQEASLDPAIAKETRAILDASYRDSEQPDLGPLIARLCGGDADTRRHAGAVLHALLVMTVEDARAGRAPGREGMKLWSGPQDFDAEVRWNIARELADADWEGDGAEAEAAASWLFHNADRVDDRTNAMRALVRIRTPGAETAIRDVIRERHPTYQVLVLALDAASERHLVDLVDAAASLRGHHREDVRNAAIDAARALGREDAPPELKPESVPAAIANWLELAAGLVVEPVPAHAVWTVLTIPADEEGGPSEPVRLEGWQSGTRPGERPHLILPWGPVVEVREGWELTPGSVTDFATHLLEDRARFDTADMDEQGRIEGQLGIRRFMRGSGETWRGSAAEVLVAAWSYQRGEDALAARIVLPLLAKADDERQFFESLLCDVAAELDATMLEAFTHARDYPRALEAAHRLARSEYSFWYHQDRAIGLAEQLPRRTDDFHDLSLPTPEAWRQMAESMPRRDQIGYLIQRLRLLNCVQYSNPGGIDYGDSQFAEPSTALDWQHPEKRTPVINPFITLIELHLEAEEMELLIPLLESTDFILAFDIERFLPQHPASLHRLQWVAGTLFEAAAREDLIDPARLRGSAAEREAQLAELRDWCRRMRGISTSDRLASRLAATTDEEQWLTVFWNLREVDPGRAAGGAIELAKQHPERTADIARLLVLLDAHDHAEVAREWERSDDAELRRWARMTLVRSGDTGAARLDALLSDLDSCHDTPVVNAAVETLLSCADPRGRAFLVSRLHEKDQSVFVPTFAFAQHLMRSGFQEGFEAVDDALEHPTDTNLRAFHEASEPLSASDVVWHLYRWLPEERRLDPMSNDNDDQRDALRTWLRSERDAVSDGRAPTMQVEPLDLPWDDWRPVTGRWIRRL